MKNTWKILAGCGCVSMLAGAALLAVSFFAGKAMLRDDLAHYENTREGRTGKLAENYVDFSFDYPKSWTLKTNDPDNINFVTAERNVEDKTYENFNVGYFRPAPTDEANEQLYREALGAVENQYAQQLREFRKVSEGSTKVGKYTGHEALYTGYIEAEAQRIDVFIRAIFLPSPNPGQGVSIMMIGTTLHPDLKRAEDLGTKGELPVLLDSFEFK